MKILLTTLNARFTHSALSLAYLNNACRNEKWTVDRREFTINDPANHIMAEIYRIRPSILCFSCYIWNIENILDLCADYKKVHPECIILLGGPEVSYSPHELLGKYHYIDFIISGEGEITLPALLECIWNEDPVDEILGISYRCGTEIITNPPRELIAELDSIITPYNEDMTYYDHKMVYYETSRGCPFNCSYCMSSTLKEVRYFSLTRVKNDLRHLIEKGIRKVKFVDRTFNSNEKRAIEIMKFILAQNGNTIFHFELCADLISEKMLDFLFCVPPGLFEFEIGVQSTCPEALEAVHRRTNWDRLSAAVNKIRSYGNIHLHLDLIAGLPYEGYERFGQSFNDVYFLKPHVIQMGFLKLLKGSRLHRNRDQFSYVFQEKAPYQVLANDFITYPDLLALQDIEELVEVYYNSGFMMNTLAYITHYIYPRDGFAFFQDFAFYWRKHYYYLQSHSTESRYRFLFDFLKQYHPEHLTGINEYLKYDFILNHYAYQIPEWMERFQVDQCRDLLTRLMSNPEYVVEVWPEMIGKTMREMKKYVRLEYFALDPEQAASNAVRLLFLYDPRSKKCQKVIHV